MRHVKFFNDQNLKKTSKLSKIKNLEKTRVRHPIRFRSSDYVNFHLKTTIYYLLPKRIDRNEKLRLRSKHGQTFVSKKQEKKIKQKTRVRVEK